jgi:hypothetical protein
MEDINLTRQEVELLQTLLAPLAEDPNNDNYTRKVAVNIISKLNKE